MPEWKTHCYLYIISNSMFLPVWKSRLIKSVSELQFPTLKYLKKLRLFNKN